MAEDADEDFCREIKEGNFDGHGCRPASNFHKVRILILSTRWSVHYIIMGSPNFVIIVEARKNVDEKK